MLSCPTTSEKSISYRYSDVSTAGCSTFVFSYSFIPWIYSMVSFRLETPITDIPCTKAASCTFSFGTMQLVIPSSLAQMTIGRTPGIAFIDPSRLSSPSTNVCSIGNSAVTPSDRSTAVAIARSYPEPSFLISAGDKLIVMRFGGKWKPEFLSAVLTRSDDSLTDDDRYPTMVNTGRPSFTSASTSIIRPSTP